MLRCLFYACLLLLSASSIAQPLTIPGPWYFHTGDDLAWAKPDVEESDWKTIKPNLVWEEQGFKDYDGIAWYRKRVVIPSSLKNQLDQGVLVLALGTVNDDDQTFFNGKLIGETAGYNIPRRYCLAESQIHWDAENVIAIRVTDVSNGGGMYGSTAPAFRRPLLTDLLAFSLMNDPVASAKTSGTGAGAYRLVWVNKAATPIVGTLITTLINQVGKVLTRQSKPISIPPGKQEQTETYALKVPQLIRITSIFRAMTDSLTDGTVIGSVPITYHAPQSPQRPYKLTERFVPAPYEQQHIEGWLGERLNRNLHERLLKVDERGLLGGYFNRPGEHPWIGEHIGKYLETAANTYRYTHNAALKAQMDRMAQQLIACQLPDGYLGTYSPDQYWTSWDVWSHKYNLLGLLAYYNLSGYEPALTACKRMGDLLCRTFGTGPGQRDIVASGTHVGMAPMSVLDPMTDLYRQTGNPKYLDFCRYIIKAYDQPNGPKIIATLTSIGRVDKTANAKAYEMLSNLVGLVKFHKITGEQAPLKAALAAWNDITANRLYVTGTSSSFEHFQGNDELPAEDDKHIGEGCVTVTWIQLNYQLLTLTGEEKYLNQLEKSAYNQLTGAENPETGCVSYYTPLLGKKPFNCGITCCTSSVPRGIALIPTFTFGQLNGNPVVLLYQAGTYGTTLTTADGKKQAIKLTASTDFPKSGQITYTVSVAKAVSGSIQFRVPDWSRNFSLNGKTSAGTNGYAQLSQTWKNGDKISVSFDMPTEILAGGSSYPGRIGFQHGPQVLSLDAALNSLSVKPTAVQVVSKALEPVQAKLPAGWVGTQTYGLKATVANHERELVLVPYADAGQTGGNSAVWLKR